MKKVLFICTGNTCRSPMAQVLFNSLAECAQKQVRAESAGMYVLPQSPASEQACIVVEELGLNLREHRARPLSRQMLEEADLVLCMTRSQAEQLWRMCPEYKEKIAPIRGYAGAQGDVIDPYGGDLEVYQRCAAELELLCAVIVNKIQA